MKDDQENAKEIYEIVERDWQKGGDNVWRRKR
jgi:hypothetical protein